MTLADLGDLFRPHEHALDLGGLVDTARPALDRHIGSSTGAHARQRCGEIAEREPDPQMMRVGRGDDDLADITGATVSPLPRRTISKITCSLTIMPSRAGVSKRRGRRCGAPDRHVPARFCYFVTNCPTTLSVAECAN